MCVKRIFLVLAVCTATLSGCASTPSSSGGGVGTTAFSGPAAPDTTRLTLLAVDRSGSTQHIRGQLMNTAFGIGTSFDASRDSFRLYRFGNSIQEVYSQLPEDDDAFALVLAQEVKISDPTRGTNYPKVAETLAEAAADATEKQIRIVIVGDGLDDYASDAQYKKRYRAAAQRLARNPHIVWVRFWGLDTGTREQIRSVFKPLGRRLQLQSLDQNPLAP